MKKMSKGIFPTRHKENDMRKILTIVMFLILTCSMANATTMDSATSGASITDNAATHSKTRGVWIGTTQSLDFSFDGTNWVTFAGATAGTVLPIQVVGARKTAASAAPTAGDVVFLY